MDPASLGVLVGFSILVGGVWLEGLYSLARRKKKPSVVLSSKPRFFVRSLVQNG